MADDIPSRIERLRAWKSLRACDFEENSPLAEDLEAAAQAFQQQAREIERQEHRLRDEKHVNKLAIERFQAAEARVRELETERDQYKSDYFRRHEDVGKHMDRWIKAEAERDKLRETLAGMHCPREINAGTIADCTGRLECGCNAGAVFVKTGAAQG